MTWPADPLKTKQFWLSADLHAFYTMGFADASEHFIGIPKQWGFGAEADSIRQFRLSDDRQALAVFDSSVYSSIILIYTITDDQADGRRKIVANTSNGSLEAWVLRHRVPIDYEHDNHDYSNVFDREWPEFLSADAVERGRRANAFPLTGTIEFEYGVGGFMKDGMVSLQSVKPPPKFETFLNYYEATEKILIEFDRKRFASRAAFAEKNLEIEVEYYRNHTNDKPCKVLGEFRSGWARLPAPVLP
jgi:hypothetical protein